MAMKNLRAAALLSMGLLYAGISVAAEPAHSHAAESHQIELDHGRKWSTDAPLRTGMQNMRVALAGALPAIHDGKLDAVGYTALANKIEAEMAYVVANCKLDPRADAQLHLVLAQLGDGVQRMKAGQRQGAMGVARALNAYGAHFDHPGWRPLGS